MTNFKSAPGFGDAVPSEPENFDQQIEQAATALINGEVINVGSVRHNFSSVRDHLFKHCDALADDLDGMIQVVCLDGMSDELSKEIEAVLMEAAKDCAAGWIEAWIEEQKQHEAMDHAMGF